MVVPKRSWVCCARSKDRPKTHRHAEVAAALRTTTHHLILLPSPPPPPQIASLIHSKGAKGETYRIQGKGRSGGVQLEIGGAGLPGCPAAASAAWAPPAAVGVFRVPWTFPRLPARPIHFNLALYGWARSVPGCSVPTHPSRGQAGAGRVPV